MIKIERISHFAAAIVTDLNRYTCLLRGVQWRVPEMRRMVEFNCTSTWLGWAEREQTGVQYSAAE